MHHFDAEAEAFPFSKKKYGIRFIMVNLNISDQCGLSQSFVACGQRLVRKKENLSLNFPLHANQPN
jgi:hypothetical protein